MSTHAPASRAIKCSACDATYQQWEGFFTHVQTRHPEEQVSCGWCGNFFNGKLLKRHMMNSHASNRKKPSRSHHQQQQPIAQPTAHHHLQTARHLQQSQKAMQDVHNQVQHQQRTYEKLHRQNMHFANGAAAATSIYTGATAASLHHPIAHARSNPQPPPPPQPLQPPPSSVMASNRLPRRQQPTVRLSQHESDAAHTLASMAARSRGKDAAANLYYVATCPHCKTINTVLQQTTLVECFQCNKDFTADKRGMPGDEYKKMARALEDQKEQKTTAAFEKLSSYMNFTKDMVLTDDEIREQRRFEKFLEHKSPQEIREILSKTIRAVIVSRRPQTDTTTQLECARRKIEALKGRLLETQGEMAKVKKESEQYVSMANRLKSQNESISNRLKRNHEQSAGGEDPNSNMPPAKKIRLNDSSAVKVENAGNKLNGGSTTALNGKVIENGNGHHLAISIPVLEEDDKEDSQTGDVEMFHAPPKKPNGGDNDHKMDVPLNSVISQGEIEAYRQNATTIMAGWLEQARTMVSKLRLNPKAKPLVDADGNGIGRMNLNELTINFAQYSDSIWTLISAFEKLWQTSAFLVASEKIPPEDVVVLREEMKLNFFRIMGDPIDWPASILGLFFEHARLPETNTIVGNIVRKNVSGRMLFGFYGDPKRLEKELGMSSENAAKCHNAIKRCREMSHPVLEWSA